jgi:hypothetical protein
LYSYGKKKRERERDIERKRERENKRENKREREREIFIQKAYIQTLNDNILT